VAGISRELAQGRVPPELEDLAARIAGEVRPLLAAADVRIVHNAHTLHKNLPLTVALERLTEENPGGWIAWCHDFAFRDPLYASDLHSGRPWDLLRTAWKGVTYVAVSEDRRAMLAELLGLPLSAVRAVPGGLDVEAFLGLGADTRRLCDVLGLHDLHPLILLPARITRRKNIELALHVLAAMRKLPGGEQAGLVVTGPPGPHNPTNASYLNLLLELRDALGLLGHAHFLYQAGDDGRPLHVSDAMMAELYRLADGMILPSRAEGFGIPVLEAGLARLPMALADLPPLRETAGEEALFFSPDGDPEPIAAAFLERITSSPSQRLRRRVREHYSWSAICSKKLIPLIEETQAHAARPA